MREIKFRAWDKVTGSWVSMGLNSISELVFINAKSFGKFTIDTFDAEAGRFILMQYTGLKDKNGKEIYEGDVVRGIDGNRESYHGQIKYKTGWGRMIIDEANLTLSYGIGEKIEIIGNIYENPELVNSPSGERVGG